MSLLKQNVRHMLGSKVSNTSENNSFAVSFMRLKLMRESKEDYLEVEKGKVRIEL